MLKLPEERTIPRKDTGHDPRQRHLWGLLPEDIDASFHAAGHPLRDGEARRLMAHCVALGRDDLEMKRPLSRSALRLVDELFDRRQLNLIERVEDPSDGFVRYLFQSPDGALSEAVRIPLHVEGRFSVCLSSQVGCAMACSFCATGRLGLTRDLAAWEMVAAWRAVRSDSPGRISGAVFMGQGEPLHNYGAVIRAADILSHSCGGRISGEAISISTVGLVPEIRRYTHEGHRFRLIVSLTSALPGRRRALLPVAGRQPLEHVFEAIREYGASRGSRVTIGWVLMGGINHDEDEVEALAHALRGLPFRLNLIDVNDDRDGGFRRATKAERDRFLDSLQRLRAPIVTRYSGGSHSKAACGMLAGMRMKEAASS